MDSKIDNIFRLVQENGITQQLTEKIKLMSDANEDFKQKLSISLQGIVAKIQDLINNPKIKEIQMKLKNANKQLEEVNALRASLEHIQRLLDESNNDNTGKTEQLKNQTDLMKRYEDKLNQITDALGQHSELINSINFNLDYDYNAQINEITQALETFIGNLDSPNQDPNQDPNQNPNQNQNQDPNRRIEGGKKHKKTNKYIKNKKNKKNITKKNITKKNKRGGYLIKRK